MKLRLTCIWNHTKQIKVDHPLLAPKECPAIRHGYACRASVVKVDHKEGDRWMPVPPEEWET